uniref:Uncharacterized protein n=1 Tax=Romanomermis culicivorax TaxID=13658 RepID=A0A915KBL5_ROMCU
MLLKYVQLTNYKGSMYTMTKILNAKLKMTMQVLPEGGANYYREYREYQLRFLVNTGYNNYTRT